MSMEPPQVYCCVISKIFSDTLSEMAPNILDIEQKIRTMPEKKTKKKHSMAFWYWDIYRKIRYIQSKLSRLIPNSSTQPVYTYIQFNFKYELLGWKLYRQ